MGKRVTRIDILKRDGIELTPQGFLKMPIYAGRVGIQTYFDSEGNELKEFRPPDEVFHEDTMKSLCMLPITNDHPTEMVNTKNARALTVGFTGETAKNIQDTYLGTNGLIFDEQTIQDIRSGKVEVSLGYDVELDFTPGEYEGEKYDVVQRKIVNNHLAIVDAGRANDDGPHGNEVKLRLDSKTAVLKSEDTKVTIIKKEDSMKLKIGDTEYEMNDELGEKVKDLLEQNDKLKADMEEKKKADEEEAKKKAEDENGAGEEEENDEDEDKDKDKKADALQAKIDALEADNKKLKESQMDAEKVDQIARQRTKVMDVANKVLDKETLEKLDEMSTSAIKKAVVEAESGEKMDEKSEIYIDARFDHIKSTIGKSDAANQEVGGAVLKDRETEKVDAAEARKEKMKKDSQAWTQPIGRTKAAN